LPVNNPNPEKLDDCLDLIKSAAIEAGEIALSHFGKELKVWTKVSDQDVKSPVSEADLEVNSFLKDKLMAAHPDFGWLSEETEDDSNRLTKRYVWVVDPIDGTRAFLRGQPHFTICIALLDQNHPIAGVVFNPALGELFSAKLGGGAFLNDDPIHVSDRSDLLGCRMIGNEGTFRSRRWSHPWPEMTIEQRNSMAYRVALVAAGQFDATVAFSLKHDWDLAAADIILREAGGLMCHLDGSAVTFNGQQLAHPGIVASGQGLYPELLSRVKEVTRR
jgi:myo-inositol-1(or 4)-monophosphatase